MTVHQCPATQSPRGLQSITTVASQAASLLASLVPSFGLVLFIGAGCASSVKLKPLGSSDEPRLRVTEIRDERVRTEIRGELNDLRDLEKARRELRAQYKKDPLRGPLTMAKLEADLVAKFRASAMERAFTQAGAKAHAMSAQAAKTPAHQKEPGTQEGLAAVQTTAQAPSAPGRQKEPGTSARKEPGTSMRQVSAGIPDFEREPTPAGFPVESFEPGLAYEEPPAPTVLKRLGTLENSAVELSSSAETPLIFDYPVTYNSAVRRWIHYFQTSGRSSFNRYLERSARYLPFIQYELTHAGLPQDLAYVAMIESGFIPTAESHAAAKGLWQFIASTGNRYGLRTLWWLDERHDFLKSTRAAIHYMTDLYRQFSSWYLVAASYNMGENGVRRLIARYRTNNFWELADRRALPEETRDYVPKIIAAMLISKAPALYGFRDLNYHMPLAYEYFNAPGGTDLVNLATYLGVSEKYLKELNPELIKGFIPRQVKFHRIRVPKGSISAVADYVRQQSEG